MVSTQPWIHWREYQCFKCKIAQIIFEILPCARLLAQANRNRRQSFRKSYWEHMFTKGNIFLSRGKGPPGLAGGEFPDLQDGHMEAYGPVWRRKMAQAEHALWPSCWHSWRGTLRGSLWTGKALEEQGLGLGIWIVEGNTKLVLDFPETLGMNWKGTAARLEGKNHFEA